MKKLLIAILTFSIGLGVYWVRPFLSPVSVCEAKNNPFVILGANVHMRGFLQVVGQNESKSISIINLENGCATGVLVDDELIGDEKAQKLFDELGKSNPDEGAYLAEVEIVGDIRNLGFSGITHCFGSPFHSKIMSIEQISPILFLATKKYQNLK